jgi:hypothetical protein
MSVKGVDKSGNRFESFEMFNNKGSNHGAAGITGTADRMIFIFDF